MLIPSRIALVTGADRGIGFATVAALARRGYRTYLSALPGRAAAAAAELAASGLTVLPIDLDVADADSAAEAVRRILAAEARLDVLVNNAASGYDADATVTAADLDQVRQTFETNVMGPWRLVQLVVPIMRANGYGRIVNVSSGAGAFAGVTRPPVYPGTPSYSVSKAAQNMLTVKLAAELAAEPILVNAIDPGWVRTAMGGPDAPRSSEEAAEDIVWLATLPTDGPTGCFFEERRLTAW